ncbi:MAG: aminotransferase class V-fold PLP-dependent enzyme [Planctomycetota bacterium]|nr:aminotransferase class V-fold PLP-dependent enzyme [Planctomycetota bacterium]
MPLVSLNIGPSEVAREVLDDVAALAHSGLLSQSHRGDAVKSEVKQAVANLRRALRVPDDYGICFQPSATAGMELVLRNCVRERSLHIVQGAFAKRFAQTAAQVGLHVTRLDADEQQAPAWRDLTPPDGTELIGVTHNETSTGLAWPWDQLRALRETHPEPLLAIDVTSSVGGMHMDWSLGDVWFGSVQKCLGLPSGLGFVLAGPRALAKARELGDARRVAGWQDLPALVEKLETGQTPETPNVLGIALLGRQMARWDLDAVDEATRAKAAAVARAFPDEAYYVRDPAWRSLTTHCLRVDDPAATKARAEAVGFELGSGYGPLKTACIRIATFPSVKAEQIEHVLGVLRPR